MHCKKDKDSHNKEVMSLMQRQYEAQSTIKKAMEKKMRRQSVQAFVGFQSKHIIFKYFCLWIRFGDSQHLAREKLETALSLSQHNRTLHTFEHWVKWTDEKALFDRMCDTQKRLLEDMRRKNATNIILV